MTFLPWIAKERSMDDILTLDSKGEIRLAKFENPKRVD